MDGGRRVLRSLRDRLVDLSGALAVSDPVLAGAPAEFRAPRRPRGRAGRLAAAAAHPAAGLMFCLAVLGGVTGYGAARGGALQTFAAAYGAPADLLASSMGLRIETISIGGLQQLSEAEILKAAGVTSENSLLFLDAEGVRAKLRALPLVQDAAVRKLYPRRVAITVVERQPFALWQRNGDVAVVSVDGVAIDAMRDDRFAALPFVVGEGANARLQDYAALLAAAGDLKARVKAGVRVADRRWDVVLRDGITIRLPEVGAAAAMAQVAALAREQRLLDKDVAAIDMRAPGRMIVRLTDDAGAARLESLAQKGVIGKGKA